MAQKILKSLFIVPVFYLFIILSYQTDCYSQMLIKITGEKWPPYNNYVMSKNEPGFMFEIIKKVFDENDYVFEYSERPWKRAISDTRTGIFDALIGVSKGDTPDFIFPEEKIGFTVNSFWIKKESNWKFVSIQSLSQVKLGVLLGMSYGKDMDIYIERNRNNRSIIDMISGENYLRRTFLKLERGRIDATIDDSMVIRYFLKETKQEEKFKIAGTIGSGYGIYLAFSPKYPKAKKMTEIIDKGIKGLKTSGKLKVILEKYGATDWE